MLLLGLFGVVAMVLAVTAIPARAETTKPGGNAPKAGSG